jgi:hypothetical protein
VRIQLVPQPGRATDLLGLPWHLPLAAWESPRLVDVPRGIHRHVVRFVEGDGGVFALKELPRRLAEREYALLHALAQGALPAVAPAGLVTRRGEWDGEALDAVLVTRHLEFSLPYRLVLSRRVLPDLWEPLLDALAELLVRLHLVGFFWGDCSLSNVLFRRDAGALCAYLVDAETAAMHEELTPGQRSHDLDIAEENLVGELEDLAAETGVELAVDSTDLASDVRRRYERLWCELTADELVAPDQGFRVEQRIRRLNELGFDVDEVELERVADGLRLRLHSRVVEPGHHRRRLLRLTGLDALENQARRLLHDIDSFRAAHERTGERAVSETAAAARWLHEVFEPAIAAVPPELCGKRDAAEIFHELLDHRWFCSEQAGRDVGLQAALSSYVERVLEGAPDERLATLVDQP